MSPPAGRRELREVLMGLGVELTSIDARIPSLIAIGWATVELDRANRELASRFQVRGAFRPTPSSVVLGATCLIAALRTPGWPTIVLLEPATEGRIAANLARHGEAWAAAWWQTAPTGARFAVDEPSGGPLGPERLIAGPAQGPFHLVVGAGTIGT